MGKFLKWIIKDNQIVFIVVPIILIVYFFLYYRQESTYEKCSKKYTIACVTDYYTTLTNRYIVKYTFRVDGKKKFKRKSVVGSGNFIVFPDSVEFILPSNFKNHYFIIEYCPKTTLTRLFLNKRINSDSAIVHFGKDINKRDIKHLLDGHVH